MNAKLQHAAGWLGALAMGSSTCAQDLTNTLRGGDEAAIRAATSALRIVDPAQLGGLMTLLRAGHGQPGARGAAAELAFAVLGWWSMQDAGIADRLYDSCTGEAWAEIELPLLHLAAIGAADGAPRAKSWIAGDVAASRRRGWRLLRMVGTDAATMNANITAAMASGDANDQLLGLNLMWEFEVASPAWTKQLEQLHASTQHPQLRQAVLWALTHTGGFRTQWMLKLRGGLAEEAARNRFDALFTYMTRPAAQRLLREIPRIQPAQRSVVALWLADNLSDARLRRSALTMDLPTRDRAELFAPALAKHALRDPTLLNFWAACLGGTTSTQRLGCLGLAHLGDAAKPHLSTIATLTRNANSQDRMQAQELRAAALHAIGALGTAAAEHLDLVTILVGDDVQEVAAAARWALPRLQGREANGPPHSPPSRNAEDPAAQLLPSAGQPHLHATAAAAPGEILSWPASRRRLVLPHLLLEILNETPPPLPKQSIPVGVLDSQSRTPWHELCALRARVLQSLGADAKVAQPLLQWLAARRPSLPGVVTQLRR